jgi:uncharacterized protein (DUF1697 family)
MQRYIAFLRGINVGGHSVKMERLRQIFTDLGLNNVSSYINSGNLFFDTNSENIEKLTISIEDRLYKDLGYKVPVFLRTVSEIDAILQQDPFKEEELTNDKRFLVVFTDELLNMDLDLPLKSSKDDIEIIALNKHEAFVVWHIINGRPPSGKFPLDVCCCSKVIKLNLGAVRQ